MKGIVVASWHRHRHLAQAGQRPPQSISFSKKLNIAISITFMVIVPIYVKVSWVVNYFSQEKDGIFAFVFSFHFLRQGLTM
jgi:hypothetical protein